MEDFVQTQFSLLALEREEELFEGLSLVSTNLKNIKELEAKGICLTKLGVESERVGLYGRQIVTFDPSRKLGKMQLPTNSIRNGDIVGVFVNGRSLLSDKLISGVVVKCSETIISVAFEEVPDEVHLSGHEGHLQLVRLANDVTYRRLKRALNDLKSCQSEISSHLVQVLFHATPPSPAHPKWNSQIEHLMLENTTEFEDSLSFVNPLLDISQKRAVLFALSRSDVAIIHGPPGTGKTTTLVEFILQCVILKQKVLACAPSNIAVDNLVERLASHGTKVLRLGHPARLVSAVLRYSLDSIMTSCDGADIVQDVRKEMTLALSKMGGAKNAAERHKWRTEVKTLRKELIEREEKLLKQLLQRADVILTTNTGASPEGPLKHLPKDHFDVVVIDECAQSLEASCWIPLLRAPKCVLAGDHKQLPPTILSDRAAKDGLSVTLMERLVNTYGNEITSLLTTQYRMHENIMKWPSQYLYGNALIAHDSVAKHLLKDLPGVTNSSLATSALFFIDTAGCDLHELETESEESKGNEGEAELVLCHVKDLLEVGVPPQEIAVIAPYNLQVDLIRQKLEIAGSSKIEVHTVDGFQGREKEAVIISFTRSNKQGEVGFLKEQRRTNVAVTRARRHLALVGDSSTISHEPFIRGLIEYCTEQGEVRSAYEYIHSVSVRVDDLDVSVSAQSQTLTDRTVAQEGYDQRKTTRFDDDVIDKIVEQRSLYKEQLEKFKKDNNEYVIEYSYILSSTHRKMIHEIAEELGLCHVSRGEGNKRHIVVSKSSLAVLDSGYICTDNSPICSTSSSTITVTDGGTYPVIISTNSIDTTVNSNSVTTTCMSTGSEATISTSDPKTANRSTNVATEGLWKCLVCGFVIPELNKELHQLRCEREQRRLAAILKEKDQKQDPVTSGKKLSERMDALKTTTQKRKSKKAKSSATGAASDEDIDTLLTEMTQMDSRCNFPSCKKNINLLDITCSFCHRKFCMTHNMAEVHGCGETAKRYARQELDKELRGEKRGGKSIDAKKRAQLQRKLDKKIDDMASGRQKKKPSS